MNVETLNLNFSILQPESTTSSVIQLTANASPNALQPRRLRGRMLTALTTLSTPLLSSPGERKMSYATLQIPPHTH